MLVLGMMSGTSADGIDCALVHLEGAPPKLRMRFDGHFRTDYRPSLRKEILRIANGDQTTPGDISQLNFAMGEQFGRAALDACKKWRIAVSKLDLIGSHGQTIYHQGVLTQVAGTGRHTSTLQIGEPSVIAAMTRVPVMADFRPADMAFGGQGAPLVPFVDYLLYRSAHVGRAALNIGGIANVTAIAPRAKPDDVFAFDTGPGNMIIDAVTETLFGMPYDRDGQIAATGRVLDPVLSRLLKARFFRQRPPKTAGREEFGAVYAASFLRHCARAQSADMVATATALTARSIRDAVQRFVLRRRGACRELVVSGGGAKNPTLMAMLRNELDPLGIRLRFSDEFGVPAEAKEAVAFAVMAYETWHRRPSNVPSATGAKRPAVLGKISYA